MRPSPLSSPLLSRPARPSRIARGVRSSGYRASRWRRRRHSSPAPPEPPHRAAHGRIEVVCGPMFCGKSEELIRRLRRSTIARYAVVCVKPSIDDRHGVDDVISHAGSRIAARAIADPRELLELRGEADVIGIDEAQFFDARLVGVCEDLAASGLSVICAGLDRDYRGLPFGPMPELLEHRRSRHEAAGRVRPVRRRRDAQSAPRRRRAGAVRRCDGRGRRGRALRGALSRLLRARVAPAEAGCGFGGPCSVTVFNSEQSRHRRS